MTISDSNLSGSELNEYAEIFELYDGETYSRYTSYQNTISFEGFQFKPAHIKRGSIERGTSFEAVSCQVTAPLEEKLTKYIANYPVTPTRIRIIRGLVSSFDSQSMVIFVGDIKRVQIEGVYAVADCTALGSILDSIWPRDIHSSFCQNTLFDSSCGLSASDYQLSFTVQSLTSKGGLISTDIGTNGSLYTGGYVVYLKDFRWITLGENNTFNLHVPFDSNVKPGVVLTAYQGCSKSAIDCKNKFNNIANFNGCPYIPSDNPVLWGF
jgi:uncharacterized phage protein (TIGR02218 family)